MTFTILAAPVLGDVITNVDAGIGELSGTNQFTFTIPVSPFPPIPQRGIPLW
ncbi:hypothetical protein [Pelosinus sp. UFO1]|uniref:hypothetical protein n=1 Tax=Pelosinus sp. UFO1 TaxID=484770 RepID=UPI001F264119|nr:hypothetical protein [Pelosinus sp. UFO1]